MASSTTHATKMSTHGVLRIFDKGIKVSSVLARRLACAAAILFFNFIHFDGGCPALLGSRTTLPARSLPLLCEISALDFGWD